MLVHLKTDSSVTKPGFKARFETQPCGGEITEEAVIQSPSSHSNRYFHYTNCTWIVTAPSERAVELK